jgi:hypothetical protein
MERAGLALRCGTWASRLTGSGPALWPIVSNGADPDSEEPCGGRGEFCIGLVDSIEGVQGDGT